MGISLRQWRYCWQFFLFLFILTIPLPRHWSLVIHQFPGIYYEFTSLSLYLSDVFLALVMVTAIPLLTWRGPSTMPAPKWLVLPMAGLLLWSTFSTIWAFDFLLAGWQSFRLLTLFAMAVVVMKLRPGWKWILAGFGGSSIIQATVALAQFFLQDDLGIRLLGELDLNRYPGGGSILQAANTFWLRGYGLTPHPNILGGILVAASLILLPGYFLVNSRYKPFFIIVFLGASAGLFTSFSRSAWLGGVLGSSFFFCIWGIQKGWRSQYGRAALSLVFTVLVLLAGLVYTQRILVFNRIQPESSQLESRAVNERATLASNSIALLRLMPLTGVGAGNTAVAMLPITEQQQGIAPQPPHNIPLLIFTELGPVGGFLWLWLMLAPIGFVTLSRRKLTTQENSNFNQYFLWLSGLTAAIFALAIIDMFDYYSWGWQQGRLLRWLIWGLWAAEAAAWRDAGKSQTND